MEDRPARRRASGALPGRCLRRFRTRRTILNFTPPAGEPRTGAPAVREIRDHLAERGVLLKKGSIVDATIISAPSVDQEREQRPAIRRCTGRGRGTGGISG